MNRTIPQLLTELAGGRRGCPALRYKAEGAWRAVAWEDLVEHMHLFGRGLLALGLEKGDRVAILSPNGPHWVFADLGTMASGGLTVPVYHTEGVEAVLHILQHSGSRFLFLHSPETADRILDHRQEVPALERIILLQGLSSDPAVLSLEDFLEGAGTIDSERLARAVDQGSAEEMATLIYTSGTTGLPKGVMLTHANITANIEAVGRLFDIGPGDECLSFLPLSHVFERVDGYYFMLYRQVVIAYAESIEAVPANMLEVRPTVMISVPRLYEKMHARILDQVQAASPLRRQLFSAALKAGRAHARKEWAGERPSPLLKAVTALAQRIVFAKLKERMGGRLRFFISGGAPLNPDIAEFFLAAGVRIYEGYGLTETAGGIAVNAPKAMRLGTVGRLFPNTRIRIAEDGEILLQGTGIFQGYWQSPAETAEVFTPDGWFRTGDIGYLDGEGYLAITDRKKDLIITAAGKNVAPQFLENRLKGDRYIANAMVYGDRKPYLTALLVPHLENLEAYAKENGIAFADACELVTHPQILQMIRQRLDALQEELPSFQGIKRFTLLSGDFAKGEITPTMKVRRNLVQEKYRSILEEMYAARNHGIHDHGFCMKPDPKK